MRFLWAILLVLSLTEFGHAKLEVQLRKKSTKTVKSKSNVRNIASAEATNSKIENLESKSTKSKKDYIAIADLYTKQKKYEKAIENLKLANKPQSIEVQDRLARVYNLLDNTAEEVRALELIRTEGKASPSQLSRLGDGYVKLKKIKEALPIYREAIEKAPKYEKSYKGLFNVFVEMNNYYDARLVILEVLEKFGEKKEWLTIFCKIEIEQNYHDNAKQICQKAIKKDPKNPDNHVYLALAFKNTENEDQARKILNNAAKQFKKSEVTQWNAGQMNCSIKNWEQAVTRFKACIKANSESGRCHLDLGKAQFELKKYDIALESLKKSCAYIKSSEVEIRRLSYDLDKNKEAVMAKKYYKSTEQCATDWFNYAKKNKDVPVHNIQTDLCFNNPN